MAISAIPLTCAVQIGGAGIAKPESKTCTHQIGGADIAVVATRHRGASAQEVYFAFGSNPFSAHRTRNRRSDAMPSVRKPSIVIA